MPKDKAIKRWNNLNKAFDTLTKKDLFDNYQMFGDPAGSKFVSCIMLLSPAWLLAEDMRPMLITWGFIGGIAILLGLSLACKKQDENKTASGIELDSKTNMKEFMIAILEDNPKGER